MAFAQKDKNLLHQWFPGAMNPFIANAPMLGHTDSRLAAAVTNAGGLGFTAGGFEFSPESTHLAKLDAQLAKARAELGTIASTRVLPVGVGFITFSPAGFPENAIPILEKHRVAAVWFSFPQSDEDHRPLIAAIREAGTRSEWPVKVFVQVGTVAAARQAVEAGADAIVVQGVDAGGHQWARGASLMALLPEVRDTLTAMNRSDVAILAAGGIVDGRGCVAALGLGADGIVMGTRFLATTECPVPDSMKQTIISTKDAAVSTIKSTRHDVFQATDLFPKQYDGRAVTGPSWNDSQNGVSDDEVIRRYNESRKQGQDDRRTVWAGASTGTINSIVSVSELIKGIQEEVKLVVAKVMAKI